MGGGRDKTETKRPQRELSGAGGSCGSAHKEALLLRCQEPLVSYLSFLRPHDLGHLSLLRQFSLLCGLLGPHQLDRLQ